MDYYTLIWFIINLSLNIFTMKIIALLTLLFIISINSIASDKTTKTTLKKADTYLKKNRPEDAKRVLTVALQREPENIEFLNKLGRICYSLDDGEREAIQYLSKAVEYYNKNNIKTKDSFEATYFFFLSLHLNGQYDEALEMLLLSRTEVPIEEKALTAKIDKEVAQLKVAITLKRNPKQFNSSNLGKVVNTKFEEHSPVVASDESFLIFTSTRPIEKGLNKDELVESIWETRWNGKEWSMPKPLPQTVNGVGQNASCSLSFDGSTLYFYRNLDGEGDIYTAERNAKGEWLNIKKLPRPINSFADETHATISPEGDMLFFTSNRDGGFGGLDIYVVRKLPNGQWSKAQNLGPNINSTDDEESPFFHADGKTLYFSSRGHENGGAFDIFKSVLDENDNWSVPENIGYPINSPDDDVFYQPTVDEQRVYYVSHKSLGEGGADLYLLEFPETDRRSMSVVSCVANPVVGDSIVNASLTVTDLETQFTYGTYKCNPSNGKFVVIIPTGKNFLFDFEYPGCSNIYKEIKVDKRAEYVAIQRVINLESLDFTPKK